MGTQSLEVRGGNVGRCSRTEYWHINLLGRSHVALVEVVTQGDVRLSHDLTERDEDEVCATCPLHDHHRHSLHRVVAHVLGGPVLFEWLDIARAVVGTTTELVGPWGRGLPEAAPGLLAIGSL
jgi:hypothetical protein